MKKLLLIILMALLFNNAFGQEKTYLLFEFMKVDNEQEQAYWETETFWEKIHMERVKNEDILGWDLWSLKPGGENQGFQYLTVTIYNNPVKMFSGGGDFGAALSGAYPDWSEDEIEGRMVKTVESRDLAVRMYLEIIKSTEGDFKMTPGMVASIDFMKAKGSKSSYEKTEIETFLPLHQKQVDNGDKGRWSFIRVMSPTGTEAYASHLTVNMFTGFDQFFNPVDKGTSNSLSAEGTETIKIGLKSRELKMTTIATLIKQVR